MCFFNLVFIMPLGASVYLCLVVTCWERADLLTLGEHSGSVLDSRPSLTGITAL